MDYLDTSGLLYLIEKIKETFVTRNEWQASQTAQNSPGTAAQSGAGQS